LFYEYSFTLRISIGNYLQNQIMQLNSLHYIDYVIVIASLVIPLLVTLKFTKKQNNTGEYFKASGALPAWAIGVSILATLISSITFLAYPGEGYASNWLLLVQGLMVPIVLVFFIGFVVPLYRNVIKLTAYEYFEKRFGFFARLYSSIGFFFAHFSKMGSIFFLLALAFSNMTGWDTTTTIVAVGFVVIFITLLGGMEAVVWLDVVQGIMLAFGGIVALIVLLIKTPGGFSAIWDVAIKDGKTGFAPYDLSFVELTFWVMVLNGIFYAIQKYGTDQTMVQRYLTAKTDKAAKRASLMGILLTVPAWALFMFVGTALYAYYQITAEPLPVGIKADAVFPHFIMTNMPVGVVGLILAALLAAAISSLTSDLNCLAAIIVGDYYNRFYPNKSEKQKMLLSRWSVIIAGLASVLIALYYDKIGGEGVLGIVFTLYSIFSGGIAGLFLLGVFSTRANRQGATIGIVACIAFTAWAMLTGSSYDFGSGKKLLLDMGSLNYTHHKYMIGVYSHLVLLVFGYLGSLFFHSREYDPQLTWVGWRKSQKLNK
jgi:SSS family solute:Na+ symporter